MFSAFIVVGRRILANVLVVYLSGVEVTLGSSFS